MKKIISLFVAFLSISTLFFSSTIFANDESEIQFTPEIQQELFPGWKEEVRDSDIEGQGQDNILKGVIGNNQDDKRAFQYIPRIIDLVIKFVAPIIVVLVILAGVKFINAGSDEEEISKAKEFFLYALIGLAFIILSYTIMKALYNLFAVG